MKLTDAIRKFLEYCELGRGHSQLTIRNYDHYLSRFLEFSEGENITDIGQVTTAIVHDYRLWLNRQQTQKHEQLSKQTQNFHLIALRSFLKFCAKNDIETLPPEKVDLADTPDRDIQILTDDEVARIFNLSLPNNPINLRDRAIIELLFSTGLRLAELTNLDRDDVNLESQEFSVRGKGGKIRVVFLSERAIDALQNYLKTRHDTDTALFISLGAGKNAENLRLSARQIQRIVAGWAKKAGVTKPVHPHTLRHVFATDLLQSGADLRSVQTLLGHSSVTTTQIYTHVTNPELKDIHKAFHGKKIKDTKDVDSN